MKIPSIFTSYSKKQKTISFILSISISIFFLIIIGGLYLYSEIEEQETNLNVFAKMDNQAIDHFFKRRYNKSENLPVPEEVLYNIKIIKIDEYSLGSEQFPKWPVPRSRYGELIQMLNRAGAKTIAFDIIMPEKSTQEEDDTLAFLLNGVQNVFFPVYFDVAVENIDAERRGEAGGEEENLITVVKYPYKPFYDAIKASIPANVSRFGFVAVNIEDIVRFMYLSRNFNQKDYYSLGILIASHYMDIPQDQLKSDPDRKFFMMGDTKIPLFKGRMMINYIFPPGEASFQVKEAQNIRNFVEEIPIKDVFEMSDETRESIFRDKLVLVGATAVAAQDIKPTPFGAIPGIYSHANLVASILGKKFIKPIPPAYNYLTILLMGIIMGLIIPSLSPWAGGLFSFLICYGYYQYAYWQFTVKGTVVYVASPILVGLVCFTAVNIYNLFAETQAKSRIAKMFKEFAPLPSPLVEKYVEDFGGDATVGGKLEHLSILFADIRGYTKMSESLTSQQVMDLLNEYHEVMGEIFAETGGVIFTYIGDAQLVVYGLEGISKTNHAAAAIKAGLMMQKRLDALKEKWEKEDKKIFEVGVGICTGELSIGVVGSKHLKQYTVIGDTVNVASRIQGMSRELASPTLIHERTYLMARHCIEAEALRPVKLKGKKELVNVYRAKRVLEITPYPGDEINDLDLEVEELHRKRREAMEKLKEAKHPPTAGREARRAATRKRREKVKKEDEAEPVSKAASDDLEICLLDPVVEQAKGEVAGEEEQNPD